MKRKFLTRHLRIALLVSFIVVNGCGTRLATSSPAAATQIPLSPSTLPSEFPETPTALAERPLGLLFVNPDNRRYFTDGVKVDGQYRSIYLTGAHTWCNFIDCGSSNPPVPFDFDKYLDFLQANHLDFFRLWRAENARGGEQGPDFWFNPMPYQRSSECCAFDGGNKFDLEKFNQEYFDRMRERITNASRRGIYLSIMLFDGWSVESKFGSHQPWPGHPYNAANNVNNINGDVNGNGQGEETHILTDTPVTALQEAYVRKVIDTVNDLNNVLYEISNESPGDNPTTQMDGSKNWQYHMISVVRTYEATKPKQHPVGMTWEWQNGNNQYLYESPADWISPGGHFDLDAYEPPATTGTMDSKVILSDTDHQCGICGSLQWVWKSFTRGENPVFMDPYDGQAPGRGAPENYDPNNPNDVRIRKNLGYTRDYANRMNLTSMTPQPKLCSTKYCLINAVSSGAEYLVYLPAVATLSMDKLLNKLHIDKDISISLPIGSQVDVDLSGSPIELSVEWFNPSNGDTVAGKSIKGGTVMSFIAPFAGDAILYIHAANR